MFGILEKIDSQYLQQASDTLMHYMTLVRYLRNLGCVVVRGRVEDRGDKYPFLIFPAWQTSTSDSCHMGFLLQFRCESFPLSFLLAA